MENFAKDLVSLLQFLVPGFVAAWIFYSLTSYPKPSQFERVIQALIFTLFIQVSVKIIASILLFIGNYWSFGEWSTSVETTYSALIAIIFGFTFSYFANNDKLHRLFRYLGITRETSYPSEWFGVFLKDITFVVLHFHDDRRLYGWPIEWPSEPTKGHFVIANPSWIHGKKKETIISGVENILIDVNDVKWVEFMKKTWENDNG